MNHRTVTLFSASYLAVRVLCWLLVTLVLGAYLFVAQTAEAAPLQPTANPPITSYLDAEHAVFRIEVEGGDYVGLAKERTAQTRSGGTGFFVSASGIAVTNNHVVTGAGILRVYLGESNEALHARVLGSSECADLAVLQVVGDEFPYLTWSDELQRGMDVYSIGFPFGTTEPTMNDGIISALHAEGQTRWSSLDEILLHSAVINPGNSGGPLVTRDGEVVGVNYAQTERNQYYAIAPTDARSYIERLQEGVDIDSIGIDGEAFTAENFSGIWVRSVKAGSTADQAGLAAGDVLLSLAGLDLAKDGTMQTYCEILRSHRTDETINLQLYRPTAKAICDGQLNGRALECEQLPGIQYRAIADSHEQVTLETPSTWQDVKWQDWQRNGKSIGISVKVAPDLEKYDNSWRSTGFTLGLSTELARSSTVDQELGQMDLNDDCTYVEDSTIKVGDFSGKYQYWKNCGNVDTYVYHVVFTSERQTVMGSLFFQGTTSEQVEIINRILKTLSITLHAQPAATVAPTPTSTPQPQTGTATILVDALNVRSGPSTNYPIIASASRNQQFSIIGQSGNCAWVMIRDNGGFEGWIAAGNQYARINGNCSGFGSGKIVSAATPIATRRSLPPQGANEGCVNFQNNLNAELTITFTGQAGQSNRSFKVAPHGNNQQCFAPGPYTYTLDAPPPWGSSNGEITIERGKTINFPINPAN